MLSSLSVPSISHVSSSAETRVPAGLELVTSVVDEEREWELCPQLGTAQAAQSETWHTALPRL